MHAGKCPKCEKVMAHVAIQPVDLKIPFQTTTYRGMSYQCPNCRTVVGAGVDFLAEHNAIAEAVAKRLKR